jgi:elongation factor Ts
MHIAFANPSYRSREDVPKDAIASEREIFEKLPEVQSKPDEIREKIVDGMLVKRFFSQSVLADQTWIHDDSLTVGRALDERDAEVVEFVRYTLSE